MHHLHDCITTHGVREVCPHCGLHKHHMKYQSKARGEAVEQFNCGDKQLKRRVHDHEASTWWLTMHDSLPVVCRANNRQCCSVTTMQNCFVANEGTIPAELKLCGMAGADPRTSWQCFKRRYPREGNISLHMEQQPMATRYYVVHHDGPSTSPIPSVGNRQ